MKLSIVLTKLDAPKPKPHHLSSLIEANALLSSWSWMAALHQETLVRYEIRDGHKAVHEGVYGLTSWKNGVPNLHKVITNELLKRTLPTGHLTWIERQAIGQLLDRIKKEL